MDTFIIVTIAVLALFAILGAGVMYAYFAGMAAKRAAQWVFQEPTLEPAMSKRELDEIDDLIRSSRKTAGLPPIN
ncbi:hypothetical protein G7047_29410 [Diaphorobacter sp. HDW4A]|uniref:hypothetical protein n=1 Tax=Diaphorobacter sp. HDW4A TaxID=2714924 RepID=UPI00140E6173|nr:hypothetical protein [Diaphorobacter sp. HDW4A]QIL80808.1 hypothetical protein G7047_13505 [Diaphorobacter sp. HDW4A]QIL83595.1 hypothetical protein G7047_29410 [Diaphorobacter sp. HDW4A]